MGALILLATLATGQLWDDEFDPGDVHGHEAPAAGFNESEGVSLGLFRSEERIFFLTTSPKTTTSSWGGLRTIFVTKGVWYRDRKVSPSRLFTPGTRARLRYWYSGSSGYDRAEILEDAAEDERFAGVQESWVVDVVGKAAIRRSAAMAAFRAPLYRAREARLAEAVRRDDWSLAWRAAYAGEPHTAHLGAVLLARLRAARDGRNIFGWTGTN
jgi:hypothetical protein